MLLSSEEVAVTGLNAELLSGGGSDDIEEVMNDQRGGTQRGGTVTAFANIEQHPIMGRRLAVRTRDIYRQRENVLKRFLSNHEEYGQHIDHSSGQVLLPLPENIIIAFLDHISIKRSRRISTEVQEEHTIGEASVMENNSPDDDATQLREESTPTTRTTLLYNTYDTIAGHVSMIKNLYRESRRCKEDKMILDYITSQYLTGYKKQVAELRQRGIDYYVTMMTFLHY
jgi:hypothetical protein